MTAASAPHAWCAGRWAAAMLAAAWVGAVFLVRSRRAGQWGGAAVEGGFVRWPGTLVDDVEGASAPSGMGTVAGRAAQMGEFGSSGRSSRIRLAAAVC